MTFLNGEWFTYRLRDILEGAVKLFVSILIDPIRLLVSSVKKNAQKAPGEKRASSRKISAVLRGLLIALPLVIILGATAASADLIFSEKITGAAGNGFEDRELWAVRLPLYLCHGPGIWFVWRLYLHLIPDATKTGKN